MPPSGYNSTQTNSVATFLESISQALENEGREKDFLPVEAMTAECRNIDIILRQCNGDLFADAVLNLTKVLYQEVTQANPLTYEDYRQKVVEIVERAKAQISNVHVPEI